MPETFLVSSDRGAIAHDIAVLTERIERIEGLLQRRAGDPSVPAWQGRVAALRRRRAALEDFVAGSPACR